MHPMKLPTLIATAAAAALVVTSTASAGFQDAAGMIEPARSTEASVSTILDDLFGGSFAGSTSAGFSNGMYDVKPVDDAAGLDASGLSSLSVTAVARYAANSQTVGMFDQGEFTPLFDVGGFGMNVNAASTAMISGEMLCNNGEIAMLGRNGGSGGLHSMMPSMNSDGTDHAVTYRVDLAGQESEKSAGTWVMFWEDLNEPQRSDRDFNDVVLLLAGPDAPAMTGAAAAPLPAGAWAGLGLIGAFGLVKARKRLATA